MDERTGTAYHEAGHAVAAVVLYIGFHNATIVPDDEEDSLGSVNFGSRTALMNLHHRSFRSENRDLLICNRAGQLAEARYTGQINTDGASSDDDTFWSRLWQMYGEQSERHAADLTRQARKLVAQHWPAIERVAAALLEQHTLTADQVKQLVENDAQISQNTTSIA